MLTDPELWKLIKRNDEQAFSALFHRYSPRIYSNAYSYLRDREACEQVVQDVFMTLWTNRGELEIKSFKAYLTAAARYRIYKQLTASKVIPMGYGEDLEGLTSYSAQNTGYSDIVYKELERKMDSGLVNLPKRCREIFLMSRKQLLTNDEIAEKLGISKRSVENQITYALKHLRVLLKDVSMLLVLYMLDALA